MRIDAVIRMSILQRRPVLFSRLCLFTAVACLFQPPATVATMPFPPTVIREKDGQWHLQDDYAGGYRIFVVDSHDKTQLNLLVKDAIPKADYDKYVQTTTAGPLWGDFALPYFVTVESKPYFCIRTWWGLRIVIDLAAAKQVTDRGLETALDAAEKTNVFDALKGGVAVVSQREIPPGPYFRLQAAVHLVGRMNDKEAVPWLRKLEPLGFETSYTTGGYSPGVELKKGDISPQDHSTHDFRRVVQLSLRRLGEAPAALPVTSFKRRGSDKPFEPRKWDRPRSERVASVKTGMTPIDVLNLIGPPDYVEGGQDIHRNGPWELAWRYDVDAQPGYTLLLVWKGLQVDVIEKVSPALWKIERLTRGDVTPALINADGSIRNAAALYTDAFLGKVTH
jgi:hypothetical protein